LRKLIYQSRSIEPVVVEQYEDWRGEVAEKLGLAPIADPLKPLEWSDGLLLTQLQENDRRNLITVLIFDQFEEFFFEHTDVPGRRQFYNFLRDCLNVPFVWVMLSLREDYVHYLLECDRLANLTLINNDILNKNVRYYLGNFDPERAKAVIRELTERSPYRLEPALRDRLVADLAAELGEVRPIELQVVGAQLLQGDASITTLSAYLALGAKPKQTLVEQWLTHVVQDCGKENQELAQRVLYALTEEPEKRPVKTKTELQREVRQGEAEDPRLLEELTNLENLNFVLTVLVGAGLAFEIPAQMENCYQLIHDYLVAPIRQQFGVKLTKQLEEERQKRKLAEQRADEVLLEKLEDSRRSNQRLRRVLAVAAVLAVGAGVAGGVATLQKKIADENALNSSEVADSLIWKGLMDAEVFNLEEQVATLKKAKDWQSKLMTLHGENRLELLATLHRAAHIPREKNRFQGHQAPVYSVAFAPDGKSILTGSGDNTAKLWSLNGRLLQTFSGHQSSVSSVAFTPDGKSILTGSWDKTAKLWSLDGRLLQTFSGHQNSIYSVAVAPNGKSILTGSEDKTARLWSLDGRLLYTFSGHQAPVLGVAFAPDSQSILTGSWDKTAKLWSLDGRLLQTFSGHQTSVSSVAFAPDGKSILTGSGDKTAKLWSLDGRLLQTFSGHQDSVHGVVFAPDGKSVLTGSLDKTAKLWSLDGRLLHTFAGHQPFVHSVAFAPDGKSILTSSGDKTAKLWSLDEHLLQTFAGHQDALSGVAFAPDGKSVLTGSADTTAKLWSLDGHLLHTFVGHQDSISGVAFSPDGQRILTGSADKTAKLWSLNGRLLHTFMGYQNSVSSVAFAPDGQSILTGNGDKTAKLWSLNGRLLHTFSDHKAPVLSVAFAPDGKSILTGSGDNTAKLWSLNGRVLQTFSDHQDSVYSVAFAPNGQWILTGSGDNTAKLWSLDGRLLQTFSGHQDSVHCVAFAPDGQSILTGSWDNTAKIWSLDGRLLQTFSGHQDSVYSVAFAPDGQSILTGSWDKTAKLWNLGLNVSLALMCDHLHDFALGGGDSTLSEDSRPIRDRARIACEGIPPPKLTQMADASSRSARPLSWLQDGISASFQAILHRF
jgi:WD40 repeat protein